jgi:LiaI-LiaF-like transmembrane region
MTAEPDPAAPTGSGAGSEPASAVEPTPPDAGPPPGGTPPSGPPASPASGSRPINRGGMIAGVILILLGVLFLAERLFDFDLGRYGWPLFVILPGVLLFLASLAAPPREGVGLAIAGAVTTVVGLILAVQNATDLWATWAYVWPLVAPGGSGVGMALYGLLRGQPDFVSTGARQVGAGLGLFVAFGLFFEGVIGLSGDPFLVGSDYLPIVLIALGVLFLLWGLFRSRRPA